MLQNLVFQVSDGPEKGELTLVQTSSLPVPKANQEATNSPHAIEWDTAMRKELVSLRELEVADLITAPSISGYVAVAMI